jgi:hypothetical protein
MSKYTFYAQTLITLSVISLALTVLAFYLHAGTIGAIGLMFSYLMFYAFLKAPDHEKYVDEPLNSSYHDRTKRKS